MITTTDIFKTIATMLREFKKPVYSANTSEGFSVECFYIELIEPSVSYKASCLKEEALSIRITFIPESEKDFARNLEIKDRLQSLFDKQVTVKDDFVLPVLSQAFTFTSNNALEMLISVEMVQLLEDESGIEMSEIIIS